MNLIVYEYGRCHVVRSKSLAGKVHTAYRIFSMACPTNNRIPVDYPNRMLGVKLVSVAGMLTPPRWRHRPSPSTRIATSSGARTAVRNTNSTAVTRTTYVAPYSASDWLTPDDFGQQQF